MKKVLLLIAAMLMLAAPVMACEATCATNCHVRPDCPTEPGIWGLFFSDKTRDVGDCGTYCGQLPGMFDWDGESVVTLDMSTGEGFCKKPSPCLYWLLCNCEAADGIEVNGKYGVTVEILTEGVSFESVASINPATITLAEYADEDAMCAGEDPMTRPLNYHFTDGSRTTIVTNSYRRLFQRNSLYIAICDLPRLIVDNRIVPYGTAIKLRLGLYDGSIVCQPDCSRLCECDRVVAVAGCHDECCAVLSYLPMGDWWSGIAITNLSAHDGSCAVLFCDGEDIVVKNYRVPAMGIKTILVNEVLEGGSGFAVIKSSFTMRAVAFGGDQVGFFALPASGCGACQ